MKKDLEPSPKRKKSNNQDVKFKGDNQFLIFQSRARPKTQFFLTFRCLIWWTIPEVASSTAQITEWID